MEINKAKLREFLLFIQEKTGTASLELIEKDFYLNVLLSKLNLEEYIFKGGTCLAKIYLDYFRFSEDLDFTFANQKLLENKSANQIKKLCKEKINELGKQLEAIGLNFVFDKADRKYVELGSNNKLVTFKIWYESVFTGAFSFIKLQINFLEKIKFEVKSMETLSLIKEGLRSEEKIYFQEFIVFYEKRELLAYDIREIAAEKIRSLVTRKAKKSRDALDLFFIYQRFKIKPEDLAKEAKEKIAFAIKYYEKYKESLILIKEKIGNIDFSYDEVKHLIVQNLKKEEFEDFAVRIRLFLQKILKEIEV
ncbi:MAG: nucleotidyl transferase AbiEii/AbiGii toxin family protein [Candidatus Woesearchaeota archaeon]|nr:nucleotidyl transferase AbiEii/AbiGii toxin family protein [Candidatus Woesearchaeota archaeon]